MLVSGGHDSTLFFRPHSAVSLDRFWQGHANGVGRVVRAFRIPVNGVVVVSEASNVSLEVVGVVPDDLVYEGIGSEDFIEEAPQEVSAVLVCMQEQAPIWGQQVVEQQQALIHKLKVVIPRKKVCVLLLFSETTLGLAPQANLSRVACVGAKRGVQVDDIHSVLVAGSQQVGEDFEIVASQEERIVSAGGFSSMACEYARAHFLGWAGGHLVFPAQELSRGGHAGASPFR